MNDDKLKSMGKMENEDPRDYLDIGSYYRQFTIVGCLLVLESTSSISPAQARQII